MRVLSRSLLAAFILTNVGCSTQPAPMPAVVAEAPSPALPLDQVAVSLQPMNVDGLRDVIGDARVVILGEQSHGDGQTFQTKIELVRALHEDLGFEVLLFEADIFGCWDVHERFRTAEHGIDAAKSCIFPIWTESAELAPLWNYLSERSKAEPPLEVAGFDAKITSKYSNNHFREWLKASSANAPAWANALEAAEPLLETLFTKTQNFRLDPAGDAKLSALEDAAPADLRIFVDSLVAHARTTARVQELYAKYGDAIGQEAKPAELNNVRDTQMAANVLYLLQDRFKDRRVIIWTASAHAAYQLPAIKMLGTPEDYFDGAVTMGGILREALGNEVHSIAFIAGGGSAGLPWSPATPIEPAKPDSFEQVAIDAGLTNHLIPLRGPNTPPSWNATMLARPLGHAYAAANWPTNFDSFIFNAEMTPSTKRQP